MEVVYFRNIKAKCHYFTQLLLDVPAVGSSSIFSRSDRTQQLLMAFFLLVCMGLSTFTSRNGPTEWPQIHSGGFFLEIVTGVCVRDRGVNHKFHHDMTLIH